MVVSHLRAMVGMCQVCVLPLTHAHLAAPTSAARRLALYWFAARPLVESLSHTWLYRSVVSAEVSVSRQGREGCIDLADLPPATGSRSYDRKMEISGMPLDQREEVPLKIRGPKYKAAQEAKGEPSHDVMGELKGKRQ